MKSCRHFPWSFVFCFSVLPRLGMLQRFCPTAFLFKMVFSMPKISPEQMSSTQQNRHLLETGVPYLKGPLWPTPGVSKVWKKWLAGLVVCYFRVKWTTKLKLQQANYHGACKQTMWVDEINEIYFIFWNTWKAFMETVEIVMSGHHFR